MAKIRQLRSYQTKNEQPKRSIDKHGKTQKNGLTVSKGYPVGTRRFIEQTSFEPGVEERWSNRWRLLIMKMII